MKIDPEKEMIRDLKELGDLLEEELKDIKSYLPTRGLNYRSNKRTVCDVFREIYLTTNDNELKQLAIEGTLMAKKMSKRLVQYVKEYGSLSEKKE